VSKYAPLITYQVFLSQKGIHLFTKEKMWAVWVMVLSLFRNKNHCQNFMDTGSFSLSNCMCAFGWCHSGYGPSLTPILDPSYPVRVEVMGHTGCYKAQHIFLTKQWQSLSEERRNKELCTIDNNKYVGNRIVCQGSITSSALWVDKNVYKLAEYCQEIIECNSSELNGNNQADNKKTNQMSYRTVLTESFF